MRIDITLTEEVLNFYSKEAKKNKRSRKAQIEITLTSFALKETIDNRVEIKTYKLLGRKMT